MLSRVLILCLLYFYGEMAQSKGEAVHVAVVGSGLAGLSAAYYACLRGAHVSLIEGEKRVGGNSAKATSGINGCHTSAQRAMNINDSHELFAADTLKSGHGLSDRQLVNVLVDNSANAVERLTELGANLSDVIILGGHTAPRTHRIPVSPEGKAMPVGFTLIKTMESNIKKLQTEHPDSLTLLTDTKALSLVTDTHGAVIGVRVKKPDGKEEVIHADAVILATGGFSNDHEDDSLLKEFANDKINFPTTNGPFAVGSGVKMARKIDANLIHMDQVQLHPTGFIDPKDETAKTKFLAAEALRGSGGILLNGKGERFVNELGTRDYVTNQILNQCDRSQSTGLCFSYLVLNEQAATRFGKAFFDFYYKVKGFFKKYDNVNEFAKANGIDAVNVLKAFEEYDAAAESVMKRDAFGKTVFPVEYSPDQVLYVAKITPVIHYTMGGVQINSKAQVLRADGSVIPSLYAAGEVTGGVHGGNRLGGNSLLECAVFGKIAADQAVTKHHHTKTNEL